MATFIHLSARYCCYFVTNGCGCTSHRKHFTCRGFLAKTKLAWRCLDVCVDRPSFLSESPQYHSGGVFEQDDTKQWRFGLKTLTSPLGSTVIWHIPCMHLLARCAVILPSHLCNKRLPGSPINPGRLRGVREEMKPSGKCLN